MALNNTFIATLYSKISYFINHYNFAHKDFNLKADKPTINNWERVCNSEFGDEGIPSRTYEDVCLFQVENREYIIIFQKPLIEYKDSLLNYIINFHPWIATKEKSKDKTVTYTDIFKWLFQNSENWLVNVVDYITSFDSYDSILK